MHEKGLSQGGHGGGGRAGRRRGHGWRQPCWTAPMAEAAAHIATDGGAAAMQIMAPPPIIVSSYRVFEIGRAHV